MNKNGYSQQGDVIIEAVEGVPDGATPVLPGSRGFVVAEGEATGHAHRISDVGGVKFFKKDGMFYMVSEKPTTLVHEEHKAITSPPGTYRFRGVKEVDPWAEEIRNVRD